MHTPLSDESGYWWIPEEPSRRYPGRLSFDPKDGAHLELSIEKEAPAFPGGVEEFPLVHGVTNFHYMPVYSPKKGKTPHPMDVLLKRSDLSDHLEPVLARWFETSAQLRSVRVLYLSALYGDHPYIENKFLSMCQAAEVFHRRFRRGEYMDSNRYENEVLPLLITRIPADLPADLVEVMKQRFEYLNELSLAKRLKELVAENKEIIREFVPDIKDVLRAIVEARNQFTHFSVRNKRTDLNGETILYYVYVLRMIVELSVLREGGVPSEVLRKATIESERYRRMFRLKRA